ncbi:MAG TPA: DUF4440 domain-containing protein [Candidatus Saccharimonadales bacterium]|nr:DUF4440 domain-containing protein [Candidatus Saccharimonadales bacterium]
MLNSIRIVGMVLALSCVTMAQTASNDAMKESEKAIRKELDAQVTAWNRGDLKGYMQGYWNSAELTFFAGNREANGWDAAFQRYRAAYVGKDREMGKLRFIDMRVEVFGSDAAFVRGGWQLTTKDGKTRNGLFTVVLKKINDEWRIIHDHSS